MKKYSLELTVFLVGAAGMILELDGSRLLAPYLGTTIVVWSSLIGVILGSLSLGYWLGGKLADRHATPAVLALIILLAALFIAAIPYGQMVLFAVIMQAAVSLSLKGLIVSVVLFAPCTALLGMVAPFAVKLKLEKLQGAGSTVGNLYAFSTLGSIAGTFLAGFFLIQYFRTTTVIFLVGLVLMTASFLMGWQRRFFAAQCLVTLILISSLVMFRLDNVASAKQGFVDIDSQYSRIWVYDGKDTSTGKPIRSMQIGDEHSSAMFLNSDDLVYEYTKYYRLGAYFNPTVNRALMLGGAAYSFPKDFLIKYPAAHLDVAEIDPVVTQLARQYFKLPNSDRLTIFSEDGRTFLNGKHSSYDVIYADAFRSFAVPYQLTTVESVRRMSDLLTSQGAVLANLIGTIQGPKSQFVRAEYVTFKAVFPQVYLIPVSNPSGGNEVQNIMLVALKDKQTPTWTSNNAELNGYLAHVWRQPIDSQIPVMTDELAPVDRYVMEMQ